MARMDDLAAPLRFETTDIDEVRHHLRRHYVDASLTLIGDPGDLTFRDAIWVCDRFFLSRMSHTSSITSTAQQLDRLLVGRVIGGGLGRELINSRSSNYYREGDSFLVAGPACACRSRADAVDLEWVEINSDDLAAVAGAPDPPRFLELDPVDPVAESLLAGSVALAGAALKRREPDPGSLLLGELSRMIAAAALACFPNTTWTSTRRPRFDRTDVHSGVVRRAVGYIDSHLGDDISATDIAGTAHVTIRALQYAFRRQYGISPMGYVRRARLDQAHRELQAADPTQTTVTAIAARWGFPHPSQFSALYRETYGVSPSQTLRGD
jgi:AraC-like DNA-binding protein